MPFRHAFGPVEGLQKGLAKTVGKRVAVALPLVHHLDDDVLQFRHPAVDILPQPLVLHHAAQLGQDDDVLHHVGVPGVAGPDTGVLAEDRHVAGDAGNAATVHVEVQRYEVHAHNPAHIATQALGLGVHAYHQRSGVEVAAPEQLLHIEPLLGSGVVVGFEVLLVLVVLAELVVADAHVGILLHEVGLTLQLVRVAPPVVALAEGDVFAARLGDEEGGPDFLLLRKLVFILEDGADAVGVAVGVLADDVLRAVGRCVVVDDDFVGERSLLHHQPVKALPQIRCLVVHHAQGADEGGGEVDILQQGLN